MTFTDAPPEHPNQLRDEVRTWVRQSWAEDITVREWWRRLQEERLVAPSWPAPYGRGWRAEDARTIIEELAAAGVIAPPQGTVGTTLAGPTLLEHGTPEQQARLLPPLLRGEEAWCQLFSEPGAGSDLAGLGTRAVRDGESFTVNGQKVWNSGADIADRGMLLARTDIDVPKHAGLTYLVLDMHQDGVEARRIRQMNGDAQFCEVFLTGARVSTADIVGSPGDGWRVAATTLRSERSMVASRAARGLVFVPSGGRAGFLDRMVGDVIADLPAARTFSGNAVPTRRLIELAQARGRNSDPHLRQQLVRYYTLTEISRITQLRARASGGRVGAGAASITKLGISRICHTSREVSFAVLGADTLLDADDAPFHGELQRVGLASLGTSIGGGTDEIQRNLLGERVLGLPREPQLDRDVAYRDLRVGTQRSTSDAPDAAADR